MGSADTAAAPALPDHDETGWAYAVIYDDLGACGCGSPVDRLELVRQVLRDCPLYDLPAEQRSESYGSPLAEWLLCLMTTADLIEHGGTVTGSWITDKGTRFLKVLDDPERWHELTEGHTGYCVCGGGIECAQR